MKTLLLTFILLISYNTVFAQGYFDYLFDYQIEDKHFSKKEYQKAAERFSFIGEYNKALEMYDKAFENEAAWTNQHFVDRILIKQDSLFLEGVAAQNAYSYVLEKAKSEQIIIINGAPHQPRHRAFVKGLLKGFKIEGFQYLGLETLGYYDTLLVERGYPFLPTGYYLREAQMGRLVREAIELEYTFFAYGKRKLSKGTEAQEQAKNIAQILEQDPKAKILIYCNYENAFEHEVDTLVYDKKATYMAYELKNLTGIDPFTIDQTQLTEHSKPEMENPAFTFLANRLKEIPIEVIDTTFHVVTDTIQIDSMGIDVMGLDSIVKANIELDSTATIGYYYRDSMEISIQTEYEYEVDITTSSVFPYGDDQAYNGGINLFDVAIFHPRSDFEDGRPSWLFHEEDYLYYINKDDITISFPCMIRAYKTDEAGEKHPAPMDIIILDEEENKPLVLPLGDYVLKLDSDLGESDEIQISVETE